MLGGDGRPIEVGDTVDVPGGFYGVIKFIGGVKGKKGTFVGVELAREFASNGKNDGDVDGTRYFTTTIPRSGIFLPIHRASKRASLAGSVDSFPPTPITPAFNSSFAAHHDSHVPAMPKFSQSVGPGARAPSPQFKQKRPSLPRPESPLRNKPQLKPTPGRAVTPGRNPSLGPGMFGKSAIGGAPRFTPSPAPGKMRKPTTPQPRKNPFSESTYGRSPSRLGTASSVDEDGELTPNATPSPRAPSREIEEELARLRREVEEKSRELDEKTHQLKDQAIELAEMESSFAELQTLIPTGSPSPSRSSRSGFFDDMDTTQLRALLREKNDKISQLTSEFDDHRQDFRSTIDTLELASAETERVYEKKVEELMAELQEFHDRDDDVANVAEQLKQLEELVAELEEGLEDARRGEAEARGEVEFLRGEVERGRSELRREREKAAAALKGASDSVDGSAARSSRDLEQRDDEIRGLKAIIHSLSSGGDTMSPAVEMPRSPLGQSAGADVAALNAEVERLMRETDELRGLVERKKNHEEELEREVEQLRRVAAQANEIRDSVISNGTAGTGTPSARDSKTTIVGWRGQHFNHEVEPAYSVSEAESTQWCEYCDSSGHDILNCTSQDLGGAHNNASNRLRDLHLHDEPDALDSSHPSLNAPATSTPLSPSSAQHSSHPSPATAASAGAKTGAEDTMAGLVAGSGGDVDAEKWCALCEREGHDVTTCPDEDVL
ncbi:hypothetical protein K490DRAFT_40123 [Saccharata proteae CBS 121410]|uniref:CAP-Gly domain-containing protein n=1 Tax=Saccharata proteae CBS 121410 TaxID=1314787 RepID=A0A9P4LXP2_9PEZI|nr:hypothetical protein K490DRAFT_40123 [Saccharata proteae CBS 121410]